MRNVKCHPQISFLVVILISFLGGSALLHPGLPPTHDGEYHIIRFYEFYQTLHDGNWYPRWAPDLNYGFGEPILNFVYSFPNYVASLLHLLGFSFIDGLKVNMLLAALMGGIFMFLWAKIFWKNAGGIIASAFYSFSPYQFVDIYIRGSVGEVWALALFPGFLWSITLFIKTEKLFYFVLSSVFLACIIFSHNILTLAFFPFAIAYTVFFQFWSGKKLLFMMYTASVFILGVGLSAVFWLPALAETKYVIGLQVFGIEKNFPDLSQLLIPSWGSEFFGSGTGNDMSVQIGIANLISMVFSTVLLLLMFLRRNFRNAMLLLFFLIWLTGIFLLMLHFTLPIWEKIPFMHYFQFPWRFLSLEILLASFLAGSIVSQWKSKLIFIILFLLPVVFGIQYAHPAHYLYRNDAYYINRSNFIDGTNSPGNAFNTIWANGKFSRQSQKAIIVQGRGKIIIEQVHSTYYRFTTNSKSKIKIAVNTLYFPGWEVFIDKRKIQIERTDRGIIAFFMPGGKHTVEVLFTNTPIRNISSICTLSCFIILLICVLRLMYHQSKQAFYNTKSGERDSIQKI